jgi:hypothetical protein
MKKNKDSTSAEKIKHNFPFISADSFANIPRSKALPEIKDPNAMSIGHKSAHTQIFRLMLYRRALHPELFNLQDRRCYKHGDYEVELWIAPAGHVARFTAHRHCLTEAVIENGDHLPETGLIHALPCLGEKDYQLNADGPLGYVTTVQTESLTENLYMATYREMQDFAAESKAVFHTWKEQDGSASLSLVDIQKYRKQFHLQAYHLVGTTGLVLRTQSIFEIL